MSQAPISGTDCLPPELVQLLTMAHEELDRYLNADGRCPEYGAPWPREPARLAAPTLGSL